MATKLCWITQGGATQGPNGKPYSTLASTRYRVLIPALELQHHGYQSSIMNKDEAFQRAELCLTSQVIIFSKSYKEENIAMALVARQQGIKIILDICDNHFSTPQYARSYIGLIKLADLVTCNTEAMAEQTLPFEPRETRVIPDPYESPSLSPKFSPGEKLVLGWYGFPSSIDGLLEHLDGLVQLSKGMPLELQVTTSFGQGIAELLEGIQEKLPASLTLNALDWNPEVQDGVMKAADIILIPSPMNERKVVKSANRMIEALRYGKAVVASPLPCYQPFSHFAYVGDDIVGGIRQTLAERESVEARIAEGQIYIQKHFSPAIIGRKWKQALESIL